MGRGIGFISLILALAVGAYLYSSLAGNATPGGGGPADAIDVTSVRMDLIAIARAECTYFATNGKYASLDELRANGDTQITRDRRPNYRYSAETSNSGFRIVADYTGPDPDATQRISVDETLTVRTE